MKFDLLRNAEQLHNNLIDECFDVMYCDSQSASKELKLNKEIIEDKIFLGFAKFH